MISTTEIIKHIKQHSPKLKAEIIIAQLMLELGEEVLSEIWIENKGTFEDFSKNEILEIKEYHEKEKILLKLCRSGFYHKLPPTFLHKQPQKEQRDDIDEIIANIENIKKEKENATRFFKPFEQAFFRLGIYNEMHELQTLYRVDDEANYQLDEFWGISPAIFTSTESYFLVHIFPFLPKIAGDFPFIKACFEHIFKVEFDIEEEWMTFQREVAEEPLILGETSLGYDSILGTTYWDTHPQLHLYFRNCSPIFLDQVLYDTKVKAKIEFLSYYLLPIAYEQQWHYELEACHQQYELANELGFLGYSTYL